MNKYLSILVALMVTLFTVNALAFTPPSAPVQGWYVSDGTGQLTTTQISALNNKIKRISDATHNEFGLVFLQSLNGATIEDASYATFRAWGIGKHGLDNGVLIMLSLKEHKSRIETGKGVGGEITDLQAKQILDGMRPALRSGNFFAAFNQALDGCSQLLESRANVATPPSAPPPATQQQPATPAVNGQPTVQQSSGGGLGVLGIFFLVLLGLGVAGTTFYFFVIAPNQEEERRRKEEANRVARQRELYRQSQAAARPTYTPPFTPPVHHTTHHTTKHVVSRPSAPLIPSVPAEDTVVDRPSIPSTSNSISAAVAAAALLESEQEEERRRARERKHEEERAEARRREREREEERAAERRRQDDEDRNSSSFDWGGGSSGGSDSGGGFGGGSSGGGGASSDW